MSKWISAWLAVASLTFAGSVAGAPRYFVMGENVQLACTQTVPETLACEYRLTQPAEVLEINVRAHDIELAAPDTTLGGEYTGKSAILFLVDTSDPARQPTMTLVARHIQALLSAGDIHHAFGLATFDSELTLRVPIGSAVEDVAAAARGLKAVGRTTELYRNTLRAVRILAEYPADRRALILFSDGLFEDQAYFHQDVIQAANASGVVIYGLGYARSMARSVALQTLRRLAEETGGYYITASDNPALPESFIDNPYAVIDNGGGFTVDLAPAMDGGFQGKQQVRVEFTLDTGQAAASIPVILPIPKPEPVIIEKPVIVEKTVEVIREAKPAPATAAPVVARPAPPPAPDPTLWYVAAGIGVVLLVLLVLMLVLLRSSKKKTADEPAAPPKVTFAFLEQTDDDGMRHPITSSVYRIGRHSSNDLHIPDPSVSRQHAEIHRGREGTFTITDLDSMNGIFVNSKQRKSTTLSEGDLVELGDVGFRFTVQEGGELSGEETVMLKTVVPPADITSGKKLAS